MFLSQQSELQDVTVTRYSLHVNNGTAVTRYWLDGQGSKLRGTKRFSFLYTLPDQPWGPPNLSTIGRVALSRAMRPGRGCDQTKRLPIRLSILLPLCAACGILWCDFGRA